MSPPERLTAGVCIVRLEAQPGHVLITITTTRNLDRSLYSAQSAQAGPFSDPELAMRTVTEFIRSFL